MRILFLTHYFPPEGNAPASRTFETCRHWVTAGHDVTVITGVPNHPDGVVYPGYRNKLLQREEIEGIHVVRVWTFLLANRGRRRVLNFLSYMMMASLVGAFSRRVDVLIATTPQFFCGLAGTIVSSLRRCPFLLEVRDIWPESITAMGAMRRSPLSFVRVLEVLERRMYASANRLVTVGDGYRDQLIKRGVDERRISVITNGIDLNLFRPDMDGGHFRSKYGIDGQFVCAYIGTIGMAAGLDTVLRAARLLKIKSRQDIRLMLIGSGAEREKLADDARRQGLDNVIFTGQIDRHDVPGALAAVDSCLVHLRGLPLFETVLPSKMFEAAAMEKPIVLGVRGDAARLVEQAGAGICIEPENEVDLVAAIERLAGDPALARRLGHAGREYIRKHFDRGRLSERYLETVLQVAEAAHPHSGIERAVL